MEPNGTRRYDGLWLFLIVLAGFLLRLSGLSWGQAYSFNGQGDAVQAYSVAVDFGRGEPRAQYIGQPNYNRQSKLPGPMWTVFCFLGLRLGGSIEGTVFGLILVNTLAIYVIYLLAQRTLGNNAALIAALLTATLPMPVYYSVGVYNPDVMCLFGALLFLALWQVTREERSGSIFWVGVLLFLMPQFHMSGLMMFPTAALLIVLARARLHWPWLVGGILAGVALYVPYLRGEAAHGWQNTHGMLGGESGGYTPDALKSLTVPLNLLVNWVPQWSRGAKEYGELGRACFGFFGLFLMVNLLSVVVAGFLVAGAFQQVRAAITGSWRRPREAFQRSPAPIFFAVLLLTPIGFALISGRPFHSRYCLILFPSVVCLAAVGFEFWRRSPRWGRRLGVGLALTTATNLWFMPGLFLHQGHVIDRGLLFVPSFRQLDTVYRRLKTHAGPDKGVVVDDADYLKSFPNADEGHRRANLIRVYTDVRERDAAAAGGTPAVRVSYRLQKAEGFIDAPERVAYREHGIALVAVRP